MPNTKKEIISKYMSELGKKSGKAKTPEYMRELALKRWEKYKSYQQNELNDTSGSDIIEESAKDTTHHDRNI